MSYVTTEKGMYYGENLKQTAYRHLATALLISAVCILAINIFAPPIEIYYFASLVEGLIIFGLFFSALFRFQFSESTALLILNIFAIASSVTLGYLVYIVTNVLADGTFIVFLTFGVAGVTVFGIYTYTSINKPDTTALQKRVLIFALIFIIFSFFGIFFLSGYSTFYLVYSGLGALLFALFMYIDFARLERQEFASPAMMALMLFYDIIYFIKYLLYFFIAASSDR